MITHLRTIALSTLVILNCSNAYAAAPEQPNPFYKYVTSSGIAKTNLTAVYVFPSTTYSISQTPIAKGQKLPKENAYIAVLERGHAIEKTFACPLEFHIPKDIPSSFLP